MNDTVHINIAAPAAPRLWSNQVEVIQHPRGYPSGLGPTRSVCDMSLAELDNVSMRVPPRKISEAMWHIGLLIVINRKVFVVE